MSDLLVGIALLGVFFTALVILLQRSANSHATNLIGLERQLMKMQIDLAEKKKREEQNNELKDVIGIGDDGELIFKETKRDA